MSMRKNNISDKVKIKHKAGNTVSISLVYLFLSLWALVVLFPFYWMITTAFKTYGESILFPPTLLPENPSWESFLDVGERIEIGHYLKNSLLVSGGVVLLQAFINIPAAYGFARFNFRGKKVMWTLVMLAFMIPTQITFVPVYIMFSKRSF